MLGRRLTINKDDIFLALICVLWSYESLIRYLAIFMGRIPIIGSMLKSYFPVSLVIILIVFSFSNIAYYIKFNDILLAFVIMLLSLITYALNLKSTEYFNDVAVTFVCSSFPMYYVGKLFVYKQIEEDRMLQVLTKVSMVCICAIIFISLHFGIQVDAEWMSNQYTPYLLLPHLLLIMAVVFERFAPVKFILLLAGTFFLLFLGNRGSVICYLVMLAILITYKISGIKAVKRFAVILAFVTLIIIMIFTDLYNSIFNGLYQYGVSHGMSTRVFLFFLGNFSGVSMDSGRGDILKALFEAIIKNPFGYGLAADRSLASGLYAHNLCVELLVEFGVFIGGAIIIFLIIQIIRAFKVAKEYWNICKMFFVLFCVGFVKLFISGSYLTDPYFFALLGVAIATNQLKKTIRNTYSVAQREVNHYES